MQFKVRVGVGTKYVARVYKSSGELVREVPFTNVITNQGLDSLAGGSNFATNFSHLAVGTGSSTPTVTQTGLDDEIARTSRNTTYGGSGGDPVWYSYARSVHTFGVGGAEGNISELGLFSDASGGTMFSRALIRDTNGDPTTIPVLGDEQLVVTAEVRLYPHVDDVTGTFDADVKGDTVPVSYTIRPIAAHITSSGVAQGWALNRPLVDTSTSNSSGNSAASSNSLAPVDGFPSGATNASSVGRSGYSSGSFEQQINLSWGINSANFSGGVGSINFAGKFRAVFDPKLDKTSDDVLTANFLIQWGRHDP